MALTGTRLAWDWNSNKLSTRDLCSGTTVDLSCGDGCIYWSPTSRGLVFDRDDSTWSWEDGRERALGPRTMGPFRFASDGRKYSINYWSDTISWPHKNGSAFANGGTWLSNDSSADFVVEGNDAYFVDGSAIMRVGPNGKPTKVFSTSEEKAPSPVAVVGGTIYAVKGWASDSFGDPMPFSLIAIKAGKGETIFTAPEPGACFAANRQAAVVCLGDELWYVPFSGSGSRKLFTVEERSHTSYKQTAVALADDGGLAWSVPSDPATIHVMRASCGSSGEGQSDAGRFGR